MQPTYAASPSYFHKVVDCQYACPAHTPVPEYIRMIAAGRYDAATVEQWLVDWSAPELKVLLMRGVLGEVRRDGAAFTAEGSLVEATPCAHICASVQARPASGWPARTTATNICAAFRSTQILPFLGGSLSIFDLPRQIREVYVALHSRTQPLPNGGKP